MPMQATTHDQSQRGARPLSNFMARGQKTGLQEREGQAGCLYSIPHARTLTLLLELNPRTSLCSLAQPLPALAHGNLLRPEDGQDRICGILGIHAAGKKTATSLPEVDFRDEQLCAAEAEESLSKWQLAKPSLPQRSRRTQRKKNIRRRFPLMSAD